MKWGQCGSGMRGDAAAMAPRTRTTAFGQDGALLWGGGGGAERVCRLVLPSVRICAPVEEGILHSFFLGGGSCCTS